VEVVRVLAWAGSYSPAWPPVYTWPRGPGTQDISPSTCLDRTGAHGKGPAVDGEVPGVNGKVMGVHGKVPGLNGKKTPLRSGKGR